MGDEKFLISTPLDDECDTVTYAQGKHKKYYDPDSKRYRIMDNKGYAKLWIANDLYEIAEGDNNIVAYITYLLSNMNYDSAITRYDKHLKARILIKNREELAEILLLVNNLPKRAIKNLDKHVIEEYGKDAINILPSEDVPKMDKIE